MGPPALRSTSALLVLFATGITTTAEAQSCKSSGGLVYLGNTPNSARSVWLSGTSAGSFSLEAAQGNQTVDTWTKDRRGLHLSTSPVVSEGNGGTHRLFNLDESKPCLVDTQNQKRDFKIPPNLQLPGGLQPIRPPIGGIFPDFKPPSLPNIRPPIGTLPPVGVMPSRPGVRPPTGGPGGAMPGLPVAVRPPIGTLPPEGVMPSRPGVRPPSGGPEGAMPGLPVAVRPPIGTLSPEGVMPTRPGVRPPTGGPEGAMPGLPVAVRPPIGTLPPDVVTPTEPGGIQPPIGTLPPDARPTDPGGEIVGRAGRRQVVVAGRLVTCPDPGIRPTRRGRPAPELDACLYPPTEQASRPPSPEVPLTAGRDLLPESTVNAWSETSFTSVRDGRYGLDMETVLGSATFGFDRKLTDDVALGISFGLENSRTNGFGRLMRAEGRGFNIGPYIAYRLTPNWAIDASLSYGLYGNDLRIVTLDGNYRSQRFTGSLNLHGQYQIQEFNIRPKVSVSYAHFRNDSYRLSGNIIGLPIDLSMPDSSFNYGVVETTMEISRLYSLSDSTHLMPYLQVGAKYEFARPNGGQIMTGDLALATPSPWSASAKGGARMLLANQIQVDASVGYLSFGQQNLDIWEGKLNLSFAF